MANYGEELTYWYLRLNGFFPITNFVLHRSEECEHSADCDVLGLRLPLVYEEIGGHPEDWDSGLTAHLDFDRPIGLLAEVKTGDHRRLRLGDWERLRYAIRRLGLTRDPEGTAESLCNEPVVETPEGCLVAKLLVTADGQSEAGWLSLALPDLARFISDRSGRYKEKNRDRIYFSSELVQYLFAAG